MPSGTRPILELHCFCNNSCTLIASARIRFDNSRNFPCCDSLNGINKPNARSDSAGAGVHLIKRGHGASPTTEMTHIAVTNDTGGGGVVWLKPVTDEEYNGGAKVL